MATRTTVFLFGAGLTLALLVGCAGLPVATPTFMGPTRIPTRTPTMTLTLQPTATTAPTATPWPTATSIPSPTPAPLLYQLTQGGCCTQPYWSVDSRRVLYIDQPAADLPLGIWEVTATQPLASPALVTSRIANYTADMAFLFSLEGEETVIERTADGAKWRTPAGGRSISLSPARTRIAWQVSDEDIPIESRLVQLWVSNLDGTEARLVASLPRGGLSGWIGEDAMLVSSRDTLQATEQVLSVLRLNDGSRLELARGERLRGGALSPAGGWLVYMVSFDLDKAANGLWLVSTDGQVRRQVDQALFGAYRWRTDGRLLIVPMRAAGSSHELWELDVASGIARRLTDPAVLSFKIANGDWTVSPDGQWVAFVESRDHNIWVMELPQ